jgi:hypothetical protein
MPPLFRHHYGCPGMAARRISVGLAESRKRNPSRPKNSSPVNCGTKPVDASVQEFFP